ncbi:MAG TPA: DUF99 family protein [Candidatus Thermoplasmatota archaeon]|nr:DUF99 family protein [Candidatus Thermoplasmatota archaeon]
MKPEVRVLGIDDGPFTWEQGHADVVGVLMRAGSYVEAVMRTRVAVDGEDGTQAMLNMILGSRYREAIQVVMLDGVSVGGFNVLDLDAMHQALELPVMTVTRDPPDRDAIEAAVRKHFPDAERRIALLQRHPLHRVDTAHNPVWVKAVGMGLEDARDLVRATTVRGALPEPLRLAHLIAAALHFGESRGRA